MENEDNCNGKIALSISAWWIRWNVLYLVADMTIPKDRLEPMRRSAMMADLMPSEAVLELLGEIEVLTKENHHLRLDIESGFMGGTYARLKQLQEKERKLDQFLEQNRMMRKALQREVEKTSDIMTKLHCETTLAAVDGVKNE